MPTRAGEYTLITDDERAMSVVGSGYRANDGGLLTTGFGSDDNYDPLTWHSKPRHIEPTYDTGNCLLSGIGEKYHQLGSWLEPKMARQMRPIEVSSATDLLDDQRSHHPYTTTETQIIYRRQSLDAGLHWQTSEADNLVADSRTGSTQHHPAHPVESRETDTLAEAVQQWLTRIHEDERAHLPNRYPTMFRSRRKPPIAGGCRRHQSR